MKSLFRSVNISVKLLVTSGLILASPLLAHEGHSSTEAFHSSIHTEWIIGLIVLIVISGALKFFRRR